MVFFDMDGTLVDVGDYQESSNKIGVSMWHVLFDNLGLLDEDRRLNKKFATGKFASDKEWANESCEILRKSNLTKQKFNKIINQQPLMKGAEKLILELKKRGYKTAIITGSFSALAKKIQKKLGIDDVIAHCDLKFDQTTGRLKGWKLFPCNNEGRAEAFVQLAKKYKFEPSECIYIGDDVNDIPVFPKAGLSIAFNSDRKIVKEAASVVVDSNDLRLVLKYI